MRRQNGHYNRSTSNTEGLVKTLVKGKKAKKPAKEVATRWNSTLAVLSRWYVTAHHQKANRDKCIKAMRSQAARSRAKNPVTDALIKVVGQVATIGGRVLEVTAACEGNDVTLLAGAVSVLLLYNAMQDDEWLMPTGPGDILATGQKEIATISPDIDAVEMDCILFAAKRISFTVRMSSVLSAAARLSFDQPPIATRRARRTSAFCPFPVRQDLEPESQTLVNVFSEQIRLRYIHEDLIKYKHILFNDATIKQLVLCPNGLRLMLKLCHLAGANVAKGREAFAKGKDMIMALCRRLEGPTLRDLGTQPNALTSATATVRPFRRGSLGERALQDLHGEDEEPQAEHASLASDAALQELERFLVKDDFGRVTHDQALGWWTVTGKADFPNLRLVALSLYGAFPSSAESEREFSTAGKDATASRSGLAPAFLRILSYLSLNSQRLREFTSDNELVKKIKKLDPKTQRDIKLGIEAMWAMEDDNEVDPDGHPSDNDE